MQTAPLQTFEEKVLQFFKAIHPLDRIERAGYVLRGVPHPESVAGHSLFVSLLALLYVDRYPTGIDREKVLSMALIHDLPEAFLMDIPMPAADRYLGESKKLAECALAAKLFTGFPGHYAEYFRELSERKTFEARLVAGLDKAQMMIKIVFYEKANIGNLNEFWENSANFRDYGIAELSRLFEAICLFAGKKRPAERTDNLGATGTQRRRVKKEDVAAKKPRSKRTKT